MNAPSPANAIGSSSARYGSTDVASCASSGAATFRHARGDRGRLSGLRKYLARFGLDWAGIQVREVG